MKAYVRMTLQLEDDLVITHFKELNLLIISKSNANAYLCDISAVLCCRMRHPVTFWLIYFDALLVSFSI